MREILKSKPLRSLTVGHSKTAGRNSAGRITIFHRGGGAKRSLRRIDLKRSTPSTGVVERIEYDPNRSSRIALVRWIQGVTFRRPNHRPEFDPPANLPGSPSASILSRFAFSSLPGKVGREVGSAGVSDFGFSLPRIAVAGAKAGFFAPQVRGEKEIVGSDEVSLGQVQKWRSGDDVWVNRIKRKAALSWQGLRQGDGLGVARDGDVKPANVGVGLRGLHPSQVLNYSLLSKGLYNAVLPGEISRKESGVSEKGTKNDEELNGDRVPVSYILASQQLEAGKIVTNCPVSKSTKSAVPRPAQSADTLLQYRGVAQTTNRGSVERGSQPVETNYDIIDLNSKAGNCIPLADIRMGTLVHEIELNPGQGAKLVRAAGNYAKVVKHINSQCLVRLPSGAEKLIDSRCRATIGVVSNPTHGARKLRKAGHSRWLGRRPVVRGVAMNPIDHPHGGGEGRTKGGRPSVSPWGKPTKAGFRTRVGKFKS